MLRVVWEPYGTTHPQTTSECYSPRDVLWAPSIGPYLVDLKYRLLLCRWFLKGVLVVCKTAPLAGL